MGKIFKNDVVFYSINNPISEDFHPMNVVMKNVSQPNLMNLFLLIIG